MGHLESSQLRPGGRGCSKTPNARGDYAEGSRVEAERQLGYHLLDPVKKKTRFFGWLRLNGNPAKTIKQKQLRSMKPHHMGQKENRHGPWVSEKQQHNELTKWGGILLKLQTVSGSNLPRWVESQPGGMFFETPAF